MTTIYLIRHSIQLRENGNMNVVDSDQIINEKIILSIEGEEAAKKISKLEELKNIDAIYSSSYVRAKATAKYIAYENKIDINIDCRLNERRLGILADLKELGKTKKHSFTEEQLLDSKLKNTDGESREEVNLRVSSFMNEILNNFLSKVIPSSSLASLNTVIYPSSP